MPKHTWSRLALIGVVFIAFSPLILASLAITTLDDGEVTRIHCFPEDRVWRFSIYEPDLAPTPKWDSTKSSRPPLALPTAIKRAHADIPQYVADPMKWVLQDVELQQYRDTGWWYYVVTYSLSDVKRTEAVSIPVLMDGTTIKGKQDPDYRPGDKE